ncbi:MAG: hypothetical protein ACK2T0_06570 [Anaerolineales bacterium]
MSLHGIGAGAQPFLAALVRHVFPGRTVVVVTEGLRTQEGMQQDLATWMAVAQQQGQGQKSENRNPKTEGRPKAEIRRTEADAQPGRLHRQPVFYPAWDVLPHETRLPHVDVISERLETLVRLAGKSESREGRGEVVVTSVVALLQRTFRAETVRERTRTLGRGERVEPGDPS